VKVFKRGDAQSVCSEANVLALFKSKCLPYLFGVLMGASNQAIITSFHGFGDVSVTLHYALCNKSSNNLTHFVVDWKLIVQQFVEAVDSLHVKYRILHNDLKSDNIVIGPGTPFQVVIVDFGKACPINCGMLYHLSMRDREQYKVNHPQIAPDLRDGLCKQSEASDVYSVGRIIGRINSVKPFQDWSFIEDLIEQCMMYKSEVRPSLSNIKQKVRA
jgi:serine/threonine protein kinase